MATELREASADRDADPALEDLHWAYRSGNLILFVGAGLSAAAGLPTREGLVAGLMDRARARGAPEAITAEIAALLDKQRFIDALSLARERLGPAELSAAVERDLDDQRVDQLPDLALAIGALRAGIRAVLTTNQDRLLERAMGGAWPAITRVGADIAQRRRFILKLHGTLADRSTWVLTRDDHDLSLQDDEKRKQALAALFNESALLFLGYSLADDEFDTVLARVRATAGDQLPRHFALVAADTVTPYRRGKLERAGVQPIPYDNADGEHRGVVRVLRLLARAGGVPSEEHVSLPPAPQSGEVMRKEPDSPYPGLLSFEQDRARLFFGRDAEIAEATQKLGDTPEGQRRWLQIEGPSGAGKSSLAKAGIVPALAEKGWVVGGPDAFRVAVFRPGADPVLTLAHAVHKALKDRLPAEARAPSATVTALRASETALASFLREHLPKGSGLLLVADQLEEAFTVAEPGPRAALDAMLARSLRDAGGPLYLITTIGSDFVVRLRELPALSAILNTEAARYHLKEMQRPGLNAAIEGPAKIVGLTWDRGLSARILEDAAAAEGSLPLMANVLQALWARRQDAVLRQSVYDALGGVGGALSRSADALLEGLGKDGRDRAQRLLLRLVKVTAAGATRRAATRGEALEAAGSGEKAERVLARLLGERDPKKPEGAETPVRLLTVSHLGEDEEDRVELCHESLIQRWETLKRWVEESRKLIERREELEAAAQAWEDAGARQDGLPGGARLAYLRGAEGESERARRYLAAAGRREKRRAGRALSIIAALAATTALFGGLSAYAWRQRGEAHHERDVAHHERDLARDQRALADRREEDANRALEALRKMHPEDAEIRLELSASYNKLGDLAQAHGDVIAAREFFEKGLKLREALSLADPKSVDLQIDLALSHGRVASVAKEARDQAEFQRHWDAARAILEKLDHEGSAAEHVKFAQAREWIGRMGN